MKNKGREKDLNPQQINARGVVGCYL